MGQPPSGGGWGQPPGYQPNQGHPQQQQGHPDQQQGYPQQQQGYPPQQGYPQQQQQGYPSQPGQQPAAPQPPPKKKSSKVGLIVGALLLPILGIGGWLVYQHFINWGYLRAPDEVKAYVDPSVDELQAIATKAAAACASGKDDGELVDNPLEGGKVLGSKGFRAAQVQCRKGWSEPTHPFEKVDEANEGAFTVSINNQEGFKCMAPNFLGIDDDARSDCVMWKGSSVAYLVSRSKGGQKAEVRVEWGPGQKKKSKK